MRTRIVKIGNSQGIRIPKALLDQTGLCGEVEIQAQGGSLVVVAAHHPRAGWDDAFRGMALQDDDRLLDGEISTTESFDTEEWEWR
jgi:antitoxin MazE